MHASGAFDLNYVIDCREVVETIERYDPCSDFVSFRWMLYEGMTFKPDGCEVLYAAREFHNDAYSLYTGDTCLEGRRHTILRLAKQRT
jgi:hypothetical protein